MSVSMDRIEGRFGATIQHGPFSSRIYLMGIGSADPMLLPLELERLALEQGYSKIFAKVPEGCEPAFLDAGFTIEASIPGYYEGCGTALFLARFLDADRAVPDDPEGIARVLELARNAASAPEGELPDGFAIRPCVPGDAREMALLYREVFPTYPFPIQEPAWILETMSSHVDYFGAVHGGGFAALASSEMDAAARSVEMTDFATLPTFRGSGLALHLLLAMEGAMRRKGMRTAFTIARAVSAGMNITFARAGYRFSGTLVNNTNISGGIESMNVWYKAL